MPAGNSISTLTTPKAAMTREMDTSKRVKPRRWGRGTGWTVVCMGFQDTVAGRTDAYGSTGRPVRGARRPPGPWRETPTDRTHKIRSECAGRGDPPSCRHGGGARRGRAPRPSPRRLAAPWGNPGRVPAPPSPIRVAPVGEGEAAHHGPQQGREAPAVRRQ